MFLKRIKSTVFLSLRRKRKWSAVPNPIQTTGETHNTGRLRADQSKPPGALAEVAADDQLSEATASGRTQHTGQSLRPDLNSERSRDAAARADSSSDVGGAHLGGEGPVIARGDGQRADRRAFERMGRVTCALIGGRAPRWSCASPEATAPRQRSCRSR